MEQHADALPADSDCVCVGWLAWDERTSFQQYAHGHTTAGSLQGASTRGPSGRPNAILRLFISTSTSISITMSTCRLASCGRHAQRPPGASDVCGAQLPRRAVPGCVFACTPHRANRHAALVSRRVVCAALCHARVVRVLRSGSMLLARPLPGHPLVSLASTVARAAWCSGHPWSYPLSSCTDSRG